MAYNNKTSFYASGFSKLWGLLAILALAACAHLPGYTLNSDVLFAFGSAQLTAEGRAEVDRVARELRAYPNIRIQVIGHTDRIGDLEANRRLSLRRAETVRARLISDGMDPNKVQALGVGASDPVVECNQRIESQLINCLAPNRRVEIKTVR